MNPLTLDYVRLPALLAVLLCICLTLPAWATEQTVIDDFDYPTLEAARAAWVPAEQSPPVELTARNGGTALRLSGYFADEARRAVCDKQVNLDLSLWDWFTLDLYVSDPTAFPRFTFYFRSGEGWYAWGCRTQAGWQTIRFARKHFGTEGQPIGWHNIDAIRLSLWRGERPGGFVAVDNLFAHRHDIAVVTGSYTRRNGQVSYSVRSYAQAISRALEEAGIDVAKIGDEDVEAGQLAGKQLAIFPYNPDMSEAEAAKVHEFIAAGGKVMLFYFAPYGLDEALGIKKIGIKQQEHEGQFSRIHLVADDILGLPAEIHQNSTQLTLVEPIPDRAQVIGWWHDSTDTNTGHPGLTMSESGLFMSHVLIPPDQYVADRALVLALVGHFMPHIWPVAAQKAIERTERIGHFTSTEAARTWIEARAQEMPNAAQIQQALSDTESALSQARTDIAAEQYPQAVHHAEIAHQLLGEAYYLAHRSRPGELRAWWNHSGTGAYPGDWPASMKRLHECGFNAIMPNIAWGGIALYESEYLPHSSIVAHYGDQIADCVAAAREYGIEVHPWKVNFYLGSTDAAFRHRVEEEGRLQVDYNGNTIDWLCPSSPENQELEFNVMVEMATKYDVAGVHFDFIRYPNANACFCPRCRERFQQDTGIQVKDWPEDTRSDPKIKEAWIQWRCDQSSRLVQRTSKAVHEIKPHCQVSTAVGRTYPCVRQSVGQDWVYWIEQGWLDFICPMDYTNSDSDFTRYVATQMGQIAGRIPFYPGIGALSSSSRLSADRVAAQINITRQLGADGFVIFQYTHATAEGIAPNLGEAILGQPTFSPNNAPQFTFELGDLTQEQTYARHVPEGATVTATIRYEEEVIVGRDFGEVTGTIVLQDAEGNTVAEHGPAPDVGAAQEVTVSAQKGLYRLAVVGEYRSSDGDTDRFITRSLPIVFGEIPDDIAALF